VASGKVEEEIRGTHLSTETDSSLLSRENRMLNDLLDCELNDLNKPNIYLFVDNSLGLKTNPSIASCYS